MPTPDHHLVAVGILHSGQVDIPPPILFIVIVIRVIDVTACSKGKYYLAWVGASA